MGRIARSLNRLGIERMRAYLAELRAGAAPAPPMELLGDAAYSDELPVDVVIEPQPFADRFTLGRYLAERLEPLGAETADRDAGLWTWLSLLLFDVVCPPNAQGLRQPGRDYRHVLEFGYRHRNRHLLFGAYRMYRRHGVRSLLLLSSAPHSESGLYHEIVSRQDLVANKGVIEAALMLYLDPRRGRPKPGAQGSLRQPGTVRRFVRVLQQLDVTYDIYGLTGKQILELLPEEFDVWRPHREIDFAAAPENEAAHAPGEGAPNG